MPARSPPGGPQGVSAAVQALEPALRGSYTTGVSSPELWRLEVQGQGSSRPSVWQGPRPGSQMASSLWPHVGPWAEGTLRTLSTAQKSPLPRPRGWGGGRFALMNLGHRRAVCSREGRPQRQGGSGAAISVCTGTPIQAPSPRGRALNPSYEAVLRNRSSWLPPSLSSHSKGHTGRSVCALHFAGTCDFTSEQDTEASPRNQKGKQLDNPSMWLQMQSLGSEHRHVELKLP